MHTSPTAGTVRAPLPRPPAADGTPQNRRIAAQLPR